MGMAALHLVTTPSHLYQEALEYWKGGLAVAKLSWQSSCPQLLDRIQSIWRDSWRDGM